MRLIALNQLYLNLSLHNLCLITHVLHVDKILLLLHVN